MALLLLFVSGCSATSIPDTLSCEEIVSAVHSSGAVPKFEKYYCKSQDNMDSFSMSLWADGLFSECEEYSLLEDYAIYLGAGTDTYEVTAIKGKTKEDVEALKGLIERRKNALAAGDKGMYDASFDAKMENSVTIVDGRYVIFLVTGDNDSAKASIDKLKE